MEEVTTLVSLVDKHIAIIATVIGVIVGGGITFIIEKMKLKEATKEKEFDYKIDKIERLFEAHINLKNIVDKIIDNPNENNYDEAKDKSHALDFILKLYFRNSEIEKEINIIFQLENEMINYCKPMSQSQWTCLKAIEYREERKKIEELIIKLAEKAKLPPILN